MENPFQYDAVLKDLFQRDRPTLLSQLAGDAVVKTFLNPEFQAVEKRVADLLVLLSNRLILHIDFQSDNHRDMAYRVGIYGLLAAEKYRMRIRQIVIYMGRRKMQMPDHLDTGGIQVSYTLIDIRTLDAATLMKSANPGDYALALLARGGVERLREIVKKANRLSGPNRQRLLTQLVILSGLRGASERLTMEFKNMGISVEIDKNVFLREIRDNALAQGRAEGRAEGKAEGKVEGKAEALLTILHLQLQSKFGPLPKWAEDRLKKARTSQAERWTKKVLTAKTLEAVIGKR